MSGSASRRAFVVASAGALVTGCAVERPERRAEAPVRRGRVAEPLVAEAGPVADGNEALRLLLQGNQRYVAGRSTVLDSLPAQRTQVAKAQHPFATVLSCVDSRVAPELLFDRGLGDLVVVRSAGGVLDQAVLGSLQFGVAELKTPLLLVLGHERCGAVTAAVAGKRESKGSIGYLVDELRPAVERARRQRGGDVVDRAVTAQISLTVGRLRRTALLGEGVRIAGARYDLDNGRVRIVG